jgi:hypothetical protein
MHYIYVEVTELIFHWRTNLPGDTLYNQMRKKYNHCWYEYKFLCIKIQANEWLCLLVNLPIDFSFFEKSLWKRLSIIINFNYNCFFEKKWSLNILKWFWKRKKNVIKTYFKYNLDSGQWVAGIKINKFNFTKNLMSRLQSLIS